MEDNQEKKGKTGCFWEQKVWHQCENCILIRIFGKKSQFKGYSQNSDNVHFDDNFF